jgi:ABC-type multidrug transport system fused ATPase/permease subunit
VDCDEIVYMKDGCIVERGSFKELMAKNGYFANVYRIQENAKRDAYEEEVM